jgi:GT2 family glycosyltransferase
MSHSLFNFGWLSRWRRRKPVPAASAPPSQRHLDLALALFDADFYRTRHAGLPPLPSKEAAFAHYLAEGHAAGHAPGALFDPAIYARLRGQVVHDNPLLDYVMAGHETVERTSELFWNRYFAERNADWREDGTPLGHYLAHCRTRALWPNPLFDTSWYLGHYEDLRASGADPLQHYFEHGDAEGRRPVPLFFPERFRLCNPDVPGDGHRTSLGRYLDGGDALKPHAWFDTAFYREHYPESAASGCHPLVDYLADKANWLRNTCAEFSGAQYLELHRDVRAAGVNPLCHFLEAGEQEGRRLDDDYTPWLERHHGLSEEDRRSIREWSRSVRDPVTFSVLIPVFNSPARWLEEAVASVERQLYPFWEICISDDASTDPETLRCLDRLSERPRVRINRRGANGHIAANTNSAATLASGDFLAFLDADDAISEDALAWLAREILAHPGTDYVYSDEDKIEEKGRRYEPYFKPDPNPMLLMAQNYACHLAAVRRSVFEELGGLRAGTDGSQDHDLALRIFRRRGASAVRHVPRILYHWRSIAGSTASDAGGAVKPYAWEAGRKAIEDHAREIGQPVAASLSTSGHYALDFGPPRHRPRVSIIMPSGCKLHLTRPCLTSLLEKTSYENYEVLLTVSDIRRSQEGVAEFFEELAAYPQVRITEYADRPFNFSWINNYAIQRAKGEVLILLNDDIEILDPLWIDKMLARLQFAPDIAMVGAKLLYPNSLVQHAGVIIGLGGVAGHNFILERADSNIYFGWLHAERDVSCVTAACAMVRRDAYDAVGGLDEDIAVAFNDVDLCLKLRRAGYRILWTPSVVCFHHESATLGRHDDPERRELFIREVALMKVRWGSTLKNDMFYNVNLSMKSGDDFRLSHEPRGPAIAEAFRAQGGNLNLLSGSAVSASDVHMARHSSPSIM